MVAHASCEILRRLAQFRRRLETYAPMSTAPIPCISFHSHDNLLWEAFVMARRPPQEASSLHPQTTRDHEPARVEPRGGLHAMPTRSHLPRHTRRCRVCAHPDRAAIEQDFLRWRSPEKLARDYGIADHSSIYRHVHATGLYARRQQTIRAALESILERADGCESPDLEVVRAAGCADHSSGLLHSNHFGGVLRGEFALFSNRISIECTTQSSKSKPDISGRNC